MQTFSHLTPPQSRDIPCSSRLREIAPGSLTIATPLDVATINNGGKFVPFREATRPGTRPEQARMDRGFAADLPDAERDDRPLERRDCGADEGRIDATPRSARELAAPDRATWSGGAAHKVTATLSVIRDTAACLPVVCELLVA